jgi:hypothetical protein
MQHLLVELAGTSIELWCSGLGETLLSSFLEREVLIGFPFQTFFLCTA